jgi:magnesium chelatase accessory protein
MSLDRLIAPRALVSLNGALLPLPGLPGLVFPPLARLLSQFSLVPRLFARHAGQGALVAQLIADTGSRLEPQGQALYARLARSPAHVAGALGMMAHWDLRQLQHELRYLTVPLLQVSGGNDLTLPRGDAARVSALVARTQTVQLPGLGHLAHEEEPRLVAALLLRTARAFGLAGPRGRAQASA